MLRARLQTIARLLLLRCGGLRVVPRKLTQRVPHYGNLPFIFEAHRGSYAREEYSPAIFVCAAEAEACCRGHCGGHRERIVSLVAVWRDVARDNGSAVIRRGRRPAGRPWSHECCCKRASGSACAVDPKR